MISIRTNLPSLITQSEMTRANNELSTSMERLSTGYQVNSASDDPAGIQIASRLQAQIAGTNAALKNTQDFIGVLQTMDASLSELSPILMRMRDLSLRAANDTNGKADIESMNKEFSSLLEEGWRVIRETRYNGTRLLDRNGDNFVSFVRDNTFQIGPGAGDTFEFGNFLGSDSVELYKYFYNVHRIFYPYYANPDVKGLIPNNEASSTSETPIYHSVLMSSGLKDLARTQSKIGAIINRMEHNINNLSSQANNLKQAHGRIMDADYAKESSSMAKQRLILESGISALNQNNKINSNMIATLLN